MKIKDAIGNILIDAAKEKSTKAKVARLQEFETVPLKQVLRLIYDDTIEFLLPDSPPPYKENDLVDLDTMLYREARRLRIFFKGGGYDNLRKERRESLFIQLLEDMHPSDSKLLSENMISHTPIKGLTKKTVESAFPTIFTDPLNFK
jgi:hypothetical protein|tara:strand:+ start:5114 stop:5554 length:441 start_codon:yes stop_codon:yes gene_type:complete